MRRLFPLLGPFLFLAAWGTAAAEAPLTDGLIEGYAASIPQVDKMMEKYEGTEVLDFERKDFEPKADEAWSPISRAADGIAASEARGDFLAVISEHGFDSIEQWGQVGDRITRAMVAIEVAEESPNAKAEMDYAMAQLEANTTLTEEQKAMMRRQLETAMGVMDSASNAPPADIEAVRPHMPMLKNLMDN